MLNARFCGNLMAYIMNWICLLLDHSWKYYLPSNWVAYDARICMRCGVKQYSLRIDRPGPPYVYKWVKVKK